MQKYTKSRKKRHYNIKIFKFCIQKHIICYPNKSHKLKIALNISGLNNASVSYKEMD